MDLVGDSQQGPGIAAAAIAVSLIDMLTARGQLTRDEAADVLCNARAELQNDDRNAAVDAVKIIERILTTLYPADC